MNTDSETINNAWNEQLSREFIDYGRFFVPYREEQIEVIINLLPQSDEPIHVVELCCGEGLLAEAILDAYTSIRVIGFDGSKEMLAKAKKRLKRFGRRFKPIKFDLADSTWRGLKQPADMVVSSLAIHHLDGKGKTALFKDVYKMLNPGGCFIVADIIDPAHPRSKALAAKAYDQFVKEKSIALEGDMRAFDFFQNEGWNIFHYLDPDDIDKPSPIIDQLNWLVKAGFEMVDVFWFFAGHAIFGGWKSESCRTSKVSDVSAKIG